MSGQSEIQVLIDASQPLAANSLTISEWVMRGGRYVAGALTLRICDTARTEELVAGEVYVATIQDLASQGDEIFHATLLSHRNGDPAAFSSAKAKFLAGRYDDPQLGLLVRRYDAFDGRAGFAGKDVGVSVPKSGDQPDAEMLALLKQFMFEGDVKERARIWQKAAGKAFVQFLVACHDPEFDDAPSGDGFDDVELGRIDIVERPELILSYHAYDVDAVLVNGNVVGPQHTSII